MKRIYSFLLAVVLLLSLSVPAGAASTDYTYSLLANGTSNTTVPLNNEVSVTFVVKENNGLDKTTLWAMQGYIKFDLEYLSYVSSSSAQIGTGDIFSHNVVPVMGKKDQVFSNRMALSDSDVIEMENPYTAVTVVFKAIKEGTTTVSLQDVNALAPGNISKTVTTEDATITIGNGSMPTPTRYTVTFDSQGGSAVSSQTVEEGSKLTEPAAPTKNGYTFGGWYKDSACNNAWNFATDTVTENMTLYAKWNEVAKKQYTLTFNTNGGSAVANVTQDEGTVINLASYTPTKSGYTFDGWYFDAGLTSKVTSVTLTKNTTVYAKWTAVPKMTYTVSFDTNGGSTVSSQTVEEGNTVTKPSDPTKTGYTFGGWYKEAACTNAWNFATDTVTANMTLYAKWTATAKQQYTLTFNTNGGSAIGSVTRDEGTVIDLASYKPTKSGYDFKGWYSDTALTTSVTAVTLTKNTTVYAKWEATSNPGGNGSGSGGVTSYPVTVNSPANGTVAADKKSAASGATVTITVTPETGYKVGTVTVKDKNGKTIAATEKDGKYSFKMPSSAVSVDVSFVKDGGSSSVGSCPKDKTCPIDPFKDTANDAWWHDGIHYCVEQGLMNGVASDQFAPNGTTTRAMIVTILWRMEGSPVTNYSMSFADVPAGQWYTEAIRWAQSTGVVTGYDAKTFGPNDNVTREQLAAILYRYTAHKGGDVSQRSTLAQFTDVSQISSWALENIQWANAVGMVNGRTATTIVPKGNATRAEAASMIQRFCQNVLKL